MSKEALLAYIREQQNEGASRENIHASLTEKGWSPELVKEAMSQTFDAGTFSLDTTQSIRGIFLQCLSIYKKRPHSFILAGAVAIALPLIIVALFALPIFYAFIPLELHPRDFLVFPMLPFIVSHVFAGIFFTILFSSLGNIILALTASHDGEIRIEESSKKAWALLPSFLLIKTEEMLIRMLLITPGFFYFGFIVWNILHKIGIPGLIRDPNLLIPTIPHIIAASFVLIVPVVVFSLFSSFSIFYLVVHGVKGFRSIRQSMHLVYANWRSIVSKILFYSIILALLHATISSIVPIVGVFISGVILTPIAILCFMRIFKNYHSITIHKQENVLDI